MTKSDSTEARRKVLLAGGAGLFGITSILAGWLARARGRGGVQAEARRLARQLDLPKGTGPMMKAFARDPEKVERFHELTRWRKARDEELRKV